MTDGLGSAGYVYNQLSQMTSESRTFAGVGTFNLSYGYNLAAQLTAITDHFGAQVGYVHDTAGRVITVTGTNFGSVSTYASNIQYRASGAMESMDYGNSRSLSMTYNTRLQPASFLAPGVMSKTYDYQADGRLKFSHDVLNPQFDRSYAYDHAARISEGLSGAEARNEGTTNLRPYKESFVYDVFGHLTQRPVNKVWSGQGGAFSPATQTYVNNKNSVWQYDAAGNLTDTGPVDYTIDAAGQTSRSVSVTSFPPDGEPVDVYGSMMDLTQSFDGDGLAVKKLGVETLLHSDPAENETTTRTTHLVRSSVLGGKVVSEIGSESEQRGFVYLEGEVLALQYRTTQTVNWEHRDPGNASIRMTSSNGGVFNDGTGELDPLGNDAGPTNTVTPLSPRLWKLTVYPGFGGAGMDGATQCNVDGRMTNCSSAFGYVAAGAGTVQQGPGFYGDFVIVNHEPSIDSRDHFSQSVYYLGFPQNPTPQTAPTGNIGQNVAGLLTGKCGEFVQSLYKQAAGMYPHMELRSQTFNLLDVFNTINSRPGAIVIEPVVVDGRRAGGTISGRMGDTANPATIHLLPVTYFNVLPASGRRYAEYSYAIRAIHETFHLAGYNDYGLAQAVHKLTGAPGLPKEGSDSFAFSDYWNDVLRSKCPEPKKP